MSVQSLKRELVSCVEWYHETALVHVRSSSACFGQWEKECYLKMLRFAVSHTKSLIKQRVVFGSDGRDAVAEFISLLD